MIEKNGKFVRILECDKLFVVGDIHGDLEVFEKIKNVFKKELEKDPKVCLVFLGDYADRGDFGLEVIEGVKELINEYKENLIALKGNHEDYDYEGNPNFRPCDLKYEVVSKRGIWYDYFKKNLQPFFNSLFIAAKYNSFLFVHGGISSKIKNEENLMFPDKKIEEDVLWSDPFEGYGEYPNPRGAGVLFGKDITKKVLNSLSVDKLIRSHQPQKAMNGIYEEHDGKILTINSTRVYGGKPIILEISNDKIKAKSIL
jgi:protein phosphatase